MNRTSRKFFLAAALAALGLASAAQATTYVANRAVGAGFVNLSITTDDTLGVLTGANILDWDVTVTEGASVFSMEGPGGANNSHKLLLGNELTATAGDLYFNFSGAPVSLLLIQGNSPNSGAFWCVQTDACFSERSPAEGLRLAPQPESVQFYSGNQVVASVGAAPMPPTSGAPEPAAWALMIAGFGLAGATLRRRRRFAAA